MAEMAGGKTLHDKLKNQSFCVSSIFAGFLQTFSYSLLWWPLKKAKLGGTSKPHDTLNRSFCLPSTQA